MSWCERTTSCSAWTRTLTFFPALSETTEICGTIPTEGGWGIKGRKLGGSGGGRSPGRGPGLDSRTNGEGGDFWKAGGRVEWEGMIYGTRLCAGYTLYPVTDAILPLSVHRIFLSLSLTSTSSSPPNELSLVCGLSSLVNLSRHSA